MGQLNSVLSWCLGIQIHFDRYAEYDTPSHFLLIREQLLYGPLTSALVEHA